MIRAVSGDELFRPMSGTHDVYTEKIRSFAEGYGFGYGFCRFFGQDDTAVICSYYGSAVAALIGNISPGQAAELSEFLTCGQFGRVLMPYALCERLGLTERAESRLLMRNDVSKFGGSDKEKLRTDASLGQIYEIARSGFDIDRDTWYTDMSHMLRHGIARAYLLDGAACAVRMYASNGVAYVSYACVLPEKRGQGLGGRLMKAVCAAERTDGSDTYIICEDELGGFYERAGFNKCGFAAEIIMDNTRRR